MFRGIPQDQFEVNLDMMETLGENAVSTAGFSLPRDDDTFRFSRHLQWDRTDANFAASVRSESRVATRRGGSNEVSFYRLVPRPNPSRKFFDWVGKGVDCHTLSKSIFKPPVSCPFHVLRSATKHICMSGIAILEHGSVTRNLSRRIYLRVSENTRPILTTRSSI